MSTRKTRPVLYEVLRRSSAARGGASRGALSLPPPGTVAPSGSESSPVAQAAPERGAAGTIAAAATSPRATWGVDLKRGVSLYERVQESGILPQIEFAEGRLLLAAAWPALLMAGVLLLVLLSVAFGVGMRFASPASPATDELAVFNFDAGRERGAAPAASGAAMGGAQEERVESNPPRAAGVVGNAAPRIAVAPRSSQTPPAAAGAAAAPEPQPRPSQPPQTDERPEDDASAATLQVEKGRTYLVIQHFRKGESRAAREALAYLQSNGVECGIAPPGLRLVARDGFQLDPRNAEQRRREQQRLDQLRLRVLQLGKEFAKTSGYNFDRCYAQQF